MTDAAATSSANTLTERLRRIRVGVRQDLQVTRHLFHGSPSYVVCDPMTFQSHRLDATEYAILVAIDPAKQLDETFEDVVKRGILSGESAESFYQFVFSLHRYNFLNLPISDEKLLFERFAARKRARRREKLLGFLFLRVPLFHPDAFLERTTKYARFLFTPWFFVIWAALLCAAGYVGVRRSSELAEPLQGVLLFNNLLLLWAVLVILKVFHEFGHAYACKHFGGYVPEMGAYFIMFTPCAYVDASAAWSFSRKRDRIIVCLGGMYVESIFAAIGMLIWAAAAPGAFRDLAYNVIFLAGVVTVLFNINPLMRYDGYYVFSDLVEVPNLRQRSAQFVLGVLKRVLLGVRVQVRPVGRYMGALLFVYGVAAMVYRIMVMFGLSILIATKFFVVGIVLAILLMGTYVIGAVRRLCAYLWFAEETAPVRRRAVAMSATVLVAAPVIILLIPMRSDVIGVGVARAETETPIRAGVDGIVSGVAARCGDRVSPGEAVATLENDGFDDDIAATRTRIAASNIIAAALAPVDPAGSLQEGEKRRASEAELAMRIRQRDDLIIASPAGGLLVGTLQDSDLGRFVRAGELLGTVTHGGWEIRALLTEIQTADAVPIVGSTVEIRPAGAMGRALTGVIRSVASSGSRRIDIPSLTHRGGGSIAVDAITQEAGQPFVEIVIAIDEPTDNTLRYGMTCRVRFAAPAEPIGASLMRNALRLMDRLLSR